MDKLKFIVIIGVFVLMVSCGKTIKFPVSDVVPAADITAKITKEGEPNYLVTIVAKNLAAPERLQTAKKIYVIWAISEAGVVRNTGHFMHENAKKATYKASFPYQPIEVFITAENEQDNCTPAGIEITRVKLLKE